MTTLENRYAELLRKGEVRIREQKETHPNLPTQLPPGVKPGAKMRRLTSGEIQSILNELPEPICVVEEIRDNLIRRQREIIGGLLRLTNVFEESIEYFKTALRTCALKALITPGTPLGLWVSDDMGASVMQGTLNTRHKPGARSNASGGIKSQTEINKLMNRSNPVVMLAFRELESFSSIMEIWRPRLVGLTLKQLVYNEQYVHVEKMKLNDADADGALEPEWYNRFSDRPRLGMNNATHGYTHRIVYQLRRDELFSFKVKLANVRKRLMAMKLPKEFKVKGSSGDDTSAVPYRVLYNSVTDAEVELHILPMDELVDVDANTNRSLYIIGKLIRSWGETVVTGKDGITGVLPITKKTTDAVRYEEVDAWKDDQGRSYSALHLHPYVFNQYGIGREEIRNLLLECGFEAENIRNDPNNPHILYVRFGAFNINTYITNRVNPGSAVPRYTVSEPATDGKITLTTDAAIMLSKNVTTDDSQTKSPPDEMETLLNSLKGIKGSFVRKNNVFTITPPKRTIKEEVDAWLAYAASYRLMEEEKIRNQRMKDNDPRKSLIYPPTSLESAATIYFAEVSGATFEQFLLQEGVDINRTYSNNAKEMNEWLGIEAARNFLIIEIEETWNNSGSSLQPVSILNATDAMTYRGSLTPSSHAGITSLPIGYLSKTTVHAASKWVTKAAVNNEGDRIQSVSAAVMVGKRIKLGTGLVRVRSTAEKATPHKENINVIYDLPEDQYVDEDEGEIESEYP